MQLTRPACDVRRVACDVRRVTCGIRATVTRAVSDLTVSEQG